MRGLIALAVSAMLAATHPAAAQESFVTIPAGQFRSVLPDGKARSPALVQIDAFQLARRPVSNADFLRFVSTHPFWRRDHIAPIYADSQYLAQWPAADSVGPTAHDQQPVTEVSWFAATAYCESQGARLPTWNEYEYVLAADEHRADARADPAWRERLLTWYSRPSNHALAPVGSTPPNVYGVQDIQGLVWEWVADFNALLIAADNREQGDPDRLRYCGEGALAVTDRDNYAVLMRLAMLASLTAADSTRNLGFRCARDLTGSTTHD
jgi:formylglycine-generating enzyme required for sulfatase activity